MTRSLSGKRQGGRDSLGSQSCRAKLEREAAAWPLSAGEVRHSPTTDTPPGSMSHTCTSQQVMMVKCAYVPALADTST